MARRLFAGASGYSFKEWCGPFYPDKMKPEGMLGWYAERLPAVEINNTFYRMPATEMLEHWAQSTPEDFRFAIKASRRITHIARIKEAAQDSVDYLYTQLKALGDKRGPVLFQLPPNLKKDLPRLAAFLRMLPRHHRAAFEFRNDTWFDDDVYAALRDAGAALAISEREDGSAPPISELADWGYVRLRLEDYPDEALRDWAQRLAATGWKEIYAFFMHEPTAPSYAQRLMQHFDRVNTPRSEMKEEPTMTKRRAIVALGLGCVMAVSIASQALAQEGISRTVILKKPLEADPTKEVTIFVAEFKPGARTGKHFHPGQEFIYVIEGEGRIEEEGKPPVELKPGVGVYFQSDPARPTYVHDGINASTTKSMKLVTTLITEKGQPLAVMVK